MRQRDGIIFDHSAIGGVAVSKFQLEIRIDGRIAKFIVRFLQRVAQLALAVVPGFGDGQIDVAKAAVIDDEDILAGNLRLAVGGFVAMVSGLILVDVR